MRSKKIVFFFPAFSSQEATAPKGDDQGGDVDEAGAEGRVATGRADVVGGGEQAIDCLLRRVADAEQVGDGTGDVRRGHRGAGVLPVLVVLALDPVRREDGGGFVADERLLAAGRSDAPLRRTHAARVSADRR